MEFEKTLLNPGAYPEKVKKVKCIQTHISWVFLTGKYVYKVKKPVDFSFLDFSTLKKRKFYCQKELELNRRLSPEIYLKVLPITKMDEEMKVGGKGKIVDWALKMRQLPQKKIMQNLLKRDGVTKKTLKKLAKIIAKFHQKAEENKKYGSSQIIKFNWIENFKQTKEFIGKIISKNDFNYIEKKILDFIEDNRISFQKRVKENKIRWCHGDFHSGNIFITDKIYIFDCIEFNKRFACQDVVSDVAFLAMDLEFHKKKCASDIFLKNYLKYTGDFEMLNLLDFYKCYRAFVRGKVVSFRTLDRGIGLKAKEKAKIEAKKYFKLALNYARGLPESF